jgi:hypothetical protein
MWEHPLPPPPATVAGGEYNNLVLQAASGGPAVPYLINPETIQVLARMRKSRADFERDVCEARYRPERFVLPAVGPVLAPAASELVRAMNLAVDRLNERAERILRLAEQAGLLPESENTNAALAAVE